MNIEKLSRVILIGLALFMLIPQSKDLIVTVKNLILDYTVYWYIAFSIFVLSIIFVVAFSKYGSIRLGDKQKMNFISWSGIIFTSTMAADVIYFAFSDWMNYIRDDMLLPLNLQSVQAYPLFHWGMNAWGFYILPATVYAFILYKCKKSCYRLSDACKPLITNKWLLNSIDVIGLVGLVAAVSTTFSITTPFISNNLHHTVSAIPANSLTTIFIILIVGLMYVTISYINDVNLVKKVSDLNYLILGLTLLLILSNLDFGLLYDSVVSTVSVLIANYMHMMYWISETNFTRDTTVFYWSYWIAWSVATPFLIAYISEGRTIREILLGGLFSGVLGTWITFIILTNFSIQTYVLSENFSRNVLMNGMDAKVVSDIIAICSNHWIIFPFLIICMILLYVSTLDSIMYVLNKYCSLNSISRLVWSLLFVIIPIILVNQDYLLESLQSISIIMALPISIIMFIIILNFAKLLNEKGK